MVGILNLYKPAGITSQTAVSKVKRLFGEKKVGHCGTLDPMAEGVLPILLGRATKVQDIVMGHDKIYTAVLKLGLSTDTQDTSGKIIMQCRIQCGNVDASIEKVREAAAKLVGTIMQIPPAYSAIKIGGVRMYDLARRGAEFERKSREIVVYSIDVSNSLNSSDNKDEYILKIHCGAGTYVRTICHDIGGMLGCGGAMAALVRNRAGIFDERETYTFERLEKMERDGVLLSALLPMDCLFADWKKITLTERQQRLMTNGFPLEAAVEGFDISAGQSCALFDGEAELIATAECKEDGFVKINRLLKLGEIKEKERE